MFIILLYFFHASRNVQIEKRPIDVHLVSLTEVCLERETAAAASVNLLDLLESALGSKSGAKQLLLKIRFLRTFVVKSS